MFEKRFEEHAERNMIGLVSKIGFYGLWSNGRTLDLFAVATGRTAAKLSRGVDDERARSVRNECILSLVYFESKEERDTESSPNNER